jgi:hypothetical protein
VAATSVAAPYIQGAYTYSIQRRFDKSVTPVAQPRWGDRAANIGRSCRFPRRRIGQELLSKMTIFDRFSQGPAMNRYQLEPVPLPSAADTPPLAAP